MNENKERTYVAGETGRNIVAKEDIAPPTMLDALRDTQATFFSSIPDDGTRENKIKIYNALNGEGENISDHLGEKIAIENIVAFPVKFTGDDGEIIETLRLTLVTDEGVTYSTVSNGVLSSLQKIMGIVGSAPWTPPIIITAKEVKTRKGYKSIVLTLE